MCGICEENGWKEKRKKMGWDRMMIMQEENGGADWGEKDIYYYHLGMRLRLGRGDCRFVQGKDMLVASLGWWLSFSAISLLPTRR